MDQSLFLVVDFSAVCRLCLSGRLLSDIHEEDETAESDSPPLREQIALLTGVQICREDSLPQKICYKCRHLVDVAYELRAAAGRAESLLLHALADATGKDGLKLEQGKSTEATEQLFDFLEKSASGNFEDIGKQEDVCNAAIVKNTLLDNGITEDTCSFMAQVQNHNAAEDVNDESAKDYSRESPRKKKPPKGKPKQKLKCEICLSTFTGQDKLIAHVRQHYPGSGLTSYMELRRPYRCEACDQPVRNRKALVEHHLRHLEVNPFVCREAGCGFVGKSKETLRHHSYRHNVRTFVCETCGAAFRRTWELKQHSIRHADEGANFPCRYCRVVCRNRLTLRTHLRSHERGRRFKCERVGCPKAFFSRADLVAHVRAHDNARIYRCHLCISSYTSQSQLNRHVRLHELRRVNKCDKCSAMFSNYSEYFNHRVGTHGAFQPHKCIGCNQGYQSEVQLEKHMTCCKLALNLKELLLTEDSAALDLPGPDQERGLLCSDESSEALDALLLRNLKSESAEVEPDMERAHGSHEETTALPADGLLYAEDMDMQSYPSPSPSPSPPPLPPPAHQ